MIEVVMEKNSMSNPISIVDQNTLAFHPVGKMRDQYNERREIESTMSLAGATQNRMPNAQTNAMSASTEDILMSGAVEGKNHEKQNQLKKTRQKRVEAYMSVDHVSVAETRGYRIRAAYRLVNYMARLTGELLGPMPLSTIFTSKYRACPSNHPTASDMSGEIYGTDYIKEGLSHIFNSDYLYTLDKDHVTYPAGITLLPPPIPDHAWPTQSSRTLPTVRAGMMEPELKDYDPMHDEVLGLWLDAYNHLAEMLRIQDGTTSDPKSGIYGTIGLFSANSARFLWPTKDELLQYEQELMLSIFDDICARSVQAVEHEIVATLGYSRPEAVMLAKTALRFGTALYQDDFDMAKVRELKSLEVISDTARLADDPRAQLAARKQLQLVAGLTKVDMGDAMESFRDLAKLALDDEHMDDQRLLD